MFSHYAVLPSFAPGLDRSPCWSQRTVSAHFLSFYCVILHSYFLYACLFALFNMWFISVELSFSQDNCVQFCGITAIDLHLCCFMLFGTSFSLWAGFPWRMIMFYENMIIHYFFLGSYKIISIHSVTIGSFSFFILPWILLLI